MQCAELRTDSKCSMRWLDAPYPNGANQALPGVLRGSCSATSGVPSDVENNSGSASVTYSNIKVGTIGST